MQRRIEGAGFDLQQIFRGSLNVLRDGVAVTRPVAQRSQDQEVEGASQQVDPRRGLLGHCVGTLHIIM